VFDGRWLDDSDGISPLDGRDGAWIWSIATRQDVGLAASGWLPLLLPELRTWFAIWAGGSATRLFSVHAIVRPVLVDAGAKTGWEELEGHRLWCASGDGSSRDAFPTETIRPMESVHVLYDLVI
jgi:hypothetical protein